MSKLFKLKQWLTLEGAAQHLSTVFGEPVTVADVLQLALEGHLKLSVYFVNLADAKTGKIVPTGQAKVTVWSENKDKGNKYPFPIKKNSYTLDQLPADIKNNLKTPHFFIAFDGIVLSDRMDSSLMVRDIENGEALELEDKIEKLEGVWDLVMLGSERLDIEHMLHQETGGPEVTLVGLNGAFVKNTVGQIYQLVERLPRQLCNESYYNPQNYYPAGGLPDDAAIVVRTKALVEFLDRLGNSETAEEKPLKERAETTYLNIIGGLLELMLDPDATERKRSLYGNQTAIINELLERHPKKFGLSKRTLEAKLPTARQSLQQD